MATIIPSIQYSTTKMTPGERRFGQRLEAYLEDDYSCWFDIPVGNLRRYPDFIILHASRGLLFIEVKDWKINSIKSIDHNRVSLQTPSGLKTCLNPIEQARQYAYQVINKLKLDPVLTSSDAKHQGNLLCPYGYGVAFTNISRKQLNYALGEEGVEVLPPHLVICQDEMLERTDPEIFQQHLWNMFNYQFAQKLTLPQVNRIRAHLFPEIRIDIPQGDLFSENKEGKNKIQGFDVTDIVKVMDMQQEQLARGFGEGHRIIHGVAGSGKTLILGFRCWYLAKTQKKPILVLCFNITLAAKLRAFMRAKEIDQQIQVYHFHDWCGEQLKTYHVETLKEGGQYWERQVASVILGVDKKLIPREQYGAVLIDEGHDFEADWLKLIVQMIDKTSNSLLLLYDDAQAIYKKSSSLDFTLSSVGIQARGRTTILKLNYRNTREILQFAYGFAKNYLQTKDADDDGVPLIEPQIAGNNGVAPYFKLAEHRQHEVIFITKCIIKWHENGVPWSDMAIIYCDNKLSLELRENLRIKNIPSEWLGSRKQRLEYDPTADKVILVTRHSCKGLEFPRVIVAGLGALDDKEEERSKEIRLLYVAMTRAKETLLLTASKQNCFTDKLVEISAGN